MSDCFSASRRHRLALLAPWLTACGGGGTASGGSRTDDRIERAIPTTIPADDWPIATPASQDSSVTAMQVLLDEGAALPFLYSMLVVRNGNLIGERYYNGAASSDLRSVASVTKMVSSMLVGQAWPRARSPAPPTPWQSC